MEVYSREKERTKRNGKRNVQIVSKEFLFWIVFLLFLFKMKTRAEGQLLAFSLKIQWIMWIIVFLSFFCFESIWFAFTFGISCSYFGTRALTLLIPLRESTCQWCPASPYILANTRSNSFAACGLRLSPFATRNQCLVVHCVLSLRSQRICAEKHTTAE